MGLTNGGLFAISTTTNLNDSCTRESGTYNQAWAYDAESITVTQPLVYSYNGETIYTSDIESGDFYPYFMIDDKPNNKWKYSVTLTYIEWEWVTLGTEAGNMFCGLNNATTLQTWHNMSATFYGDNGTLNATGGVQESGSNQAIDGAHTLSTGDKLRITFASAAPSSTNITFPQIPFKSIINSSFKS